MVVGGGVSGGTKSHEVLARVLFSGQGGSETDEDDAPEEQAPPRGASDSSSAATASQSALEAYAQEVLQRRAAGLVSPDSLGEEGGYSPPGSEASTGTIGTLTKDTEARLRLQQMQRFLRRQEMSRRAHDPERRAEVEQKRRGSVCGTGVAGRKTLGASSKEALGTLDDSKILKRGGFGTEQRRSVFDILPQDGSKAGAGLARAKRNSIAVMMGAGRPMSARSSFSSGGGPAGRRVSVADAAMDAIQSLQKPVPESKPDQGWSLAGKVRCPSTSEAPRQPRASAGGAEMAPDQDVPRARRPSVVGFGSSAAARPQPKAGSAKPSSPATTTAAPSRPAAADLLRAEGTANAAGSGEDDDDEEPLPLNPIALAIAERARQLSTQPLSERQALFEAAMQEHAEWLTSVLFAADARKPRVDIQVRL